MAIKTLILLGVWWNLIIGLPQFNTSTANHTQQPIAQSKMRLLERNLITPNLYTDKLKLQISIVDLPGIRVKGSNWEGSYHLYFVAEAEYDKFLDKMRKQSNGNFSMNPTASDFPVKILLAEGNFKKTDLSTLSGKWYEQAEIEFKSKILPQEQTKFARLLLSYSVKIFDAKLQLPLYRSDTFTTYPFMDGIAAKEKDLPRDKVQAHFFVTANGELFASQRPRTRQDTQWP